MRSVSYLVLLLVVVVAASLLSECQSLRFDLKSGRIKCITEDIKINSLSVGKYFVINPNDGQPMPESHKITVTVTASYKNKYHNLDRVESGEFAFTASEQGDYLTCFRAVDYRPEATITIDFDWKTGISAKDWTNVAKKGSVNLMEWELKKLEDTIGSIHQEMFYLREREDQMQELNRSTNSRMAWMSFLSLVVCLSVAGLQLWHLKTFFEKKKLI